MKFELYKGKDGQWYWRFISSNGREIFRSTDGYGGKADAINALNLARGSATAVCWEQQQDGTWKQFKP